jgi:hypothetical protein
MFIAIVITWFKDICLEITVFPYSRILILQFGHSSALIKAYFAWIVGNYHMEKCNAVKCVNA